MLFWGMSIQQLPEFLDRLKSISAAEGHCTLKSLGYSCRN